MANTVREVFAQLPDAEVVVVDDGSQDRTAQAAAAAGASVLRLPFNLGVGGAMRAGFKYAERRGHDVVVQVDADGQHDPADVVRLVEALEYADVVIGARFAELGDYTVKGPRKWAMRLLSFSLSRFAKVRLTDTTSGFRAAGRPAIRLYARHYPAEYLGDTVESLVIALRAGYRVTQVPVIMRPRQGGVASHGSAKAAVYLMRAFMALGLALFRRWPDLGGDPGGAPGKAVA